MCIKKVQIGSHYNMNYVLFKNNVIYLSIFVCVGFSWLLVLSPVLVSQGYSSVAVSGLLIAVAFLVEDRLQAMRTSVVAACGLSSCGSWALEHRLNRGAWAQLFHGMWDLPGSGIEPMSLALAGGFLTTGPPEKSKLPLFLND